MKHTYLLVDSRKEQRAGTPVMPIIEVSNRIYKKTKELLTLNQYDFSETTEDKDGIRVHRVKLNEPMPCSLAQFILENL